MGKKSGIFTEGQHVFAKVKGYSPWPAKITKAISKSRYSVYFYGTGETASVKSEDLDPYNEANCKRFNTDRQLKKNDYKEAVDQIQQALEGNDPAPLNPEVKNVKELDNTTDNDNSADESQLKIAEDVPKSTPQPPKKKAVVAANRVKNVEVFSPEPETKENDEKVSRSGRKIKEKKMNLDEMDPDEMFTQPRKRFKNEEGKQKPAVVVTLNDSNTEIEAFRASKMHILQDPVKMGLLENQYEMIHIMQDIKLALGLEQQADIEKALELLENFRLKVLPHITDLMLLKYPNTVDTVKRLRKYIGNVQSWSLEATQIQNFKEKAEKLRATALMIYDKFKSLFNFTDDAPFWNKFAEEQKSFNEKYNILSPSDLFEGLSVDELDSFVNNRLVSETDAEVPQITEMMEEEPPAEEVNEKLAEEPTPIETETVN